MKKLNLVCGIVLLSSFSAMAADSKGGLFIEPMLTYESGSSDVKFPAPAGSSTSDIDGFGVGARLGFHVHEAVFLGLDGRYSLADYKNDDTDINAGATAYNYGPVIGIQMPTTIGLRVWASYIMGGQLDPEKDNGIDLKFKDASGYRVGAGIKLAAVSLNLEYQEIKYNETELQNGGFFSGSTNNVTSENHSVVLSVSFPISL